MLAVIVGILLGNVLIVTVLGPALQKLRELLLGFSRITLPFKPLWVAGKVMSDHERREAAEIARRDFNRLFRDYVIAFGAFKKVGTVFVGSIAVLVCAIAWNMPWAMRARLLTMTLAVALIVTILGFLQKAFAPTPTELVSIDFLQNNFSNLHLEALFNCSRLHINYGRAIGANDPVMHFSLFQELLFLDYKLLLAVSDARCSRIHFVSYGPINSRSKFTQYWTPQLANFSIKLGDFSYSDALLTNKLLSIHLWLFIPTPSGWVKETSDSPRFISEELTVQMGGQVGSPIVGSSCSWNSVDREVEFDRQSVWGFKTWKILYAKLRQENSPQAIVRMYGEKVVKCKSIQIEDYPDGISIKKA
jgi:hypothetical protein